MLPPKLNMSVQSYCDVCNDMAWGFSYSRVTSYETACGKWLDFTAWIRIIVDLANVHNTSPIFQVFSHSVHICLLEESSHCIYKSCVNKYLHSIVLIFDTMGGIKPCME